MDWSNDVHMLYRIILKLGGKIQTVEDHGDNTYSVHIDWPITHYDMNDFYEPEPEPIISIIPYTVYLGPRE